MIEIPLEYIPWIMRILLLMSAFFGYRVIVDAMRDKVWRDD